MKMKDILISKIGLYLVCVLIFNIFLTSQGYSEEECGMRAEPYLYEGDMRLFDGELKGAQEIYEFVLK